MTKNELFEIFDKYDTFSFCEKGESIHGIKWADLNGLADELVKLFATPDVIKPFNSEREALDFINIHIPLAIKPINKTAKTMFVSPFSSANAQKIVIESLAKSLFNDL